MDIQIDKDQLENYALVYEGNCPRCNVAVEALNKEGFHSVILEEPGAQISHDFAEPLCHVMVPKEEKTSAEDFLGKWEQQGQENIEKITAEMPGQLGTSLLWTLPFVVILFLTVDSVNCILFSILIWAGILIFIANKDRIFKRDEPKETDNTGSD